MYKCKNFTIEELVPPDVLQDIGEELCWGLLDERLLVTIDALREVYGPMTINNWHIGGNRRQCGFRNDEGTGAKYSQHRFGRAADLLPKNKKPAEIRADILKNPKKFGFITAMENVEGWLHIDVRNCEAIKVFNP